uniref:Uncharacterized protein n=1 Tax=Panagrolaimus sp. ES5 TaxID=591445 RepID=A0AC34GDG0_9BILA
MENKIKRPFLATGISSSADAEENEEPKKKNRLASAKTSLSSTQSRILPKPVSKLNKEILSNLKNRISEQMPSDSETRLIPVEYLRNDFTVSSPSQSHVKIILQQILGHKWKMDDIQLIVNKQDRTEFYDVIVGNAVFNAVKQFNETVADKQQQIITMNCRVFKALDFDQKLMVNASYHKSKMTDFEFTVLQEAKLLHSIVATHSLSVPSGKKEFEEFVELLKLYFPQTYSPVSLDII